MSTPLPSAMELLKAAKANFMKRNKFFMAVVAVPSAFYLVGSILMATANAAAMAVGGILLLIGAVLYLYSTVALILGFEQESMSDWRSAFTAARGKVLGLVWTGILVGIVVMIGSLFLILPGIYLAILLSFYPYASVLEGKRGWDAATRSKELVKGRWWQVFGRNLVVGLIIGIFYAIIAGIAGVIDETYVLPVVDFLLTIVITPISVGVSYLMFKHLKANPMTVAQAPAAPVQNQPMA